MSDPSKLSDQELQAELDCLRAEKDRLQNLAHEAREALLPLVAEHRRRLMLKDMAARYGEKAMSQVVRPRGIESQSQVGQPGS